ncbi:fumarylacetoacetate hydrolase family protein [Promicromonospora vindobonensis]|uniref:Fumarylacetoacetate hydrolase family protein n=1 Tax=Promicromonospora vindobonensis TaxID=195748 RepID=A0ABW5VM47_9MICO
MRIARIATTTGPTYVRADGDSYVPCEDPFVAFAAGRDPRPTGAAPVPAAQAEVLAPCEPRLVVGIAQNGPDAPLPVQAWLKSPRTVVPSGTGVRLRRDVGRVIAEGEVAVVIGRPTEGLDVRNAHEYVLGVTAVNDVTNPDRNAVDVRNFEGKGGAGYTPLGPFLETDIDLDRVDLHVAINGEERAATGSHELPSSIAACLAYVASWVELGPGDVVMTGAPHSHFAVVPGDLVEITVAGARLVTPCL